MINSAALIYFDDINDDEDDVFHFKYIVMQANQTKGFQLLEKAAFAETAFCRPNEIPDEKSLFRHPPQISSFCAVLRRQWQRLFKTRLL